MDALVPCSACARHVRDGEETCPFCGGAVPRAAIRALPHVRLGRAATIAFGIATAALACDEKKPAASPSSTAPDASAQAVPTFTAPPVDTNMVKPYGAPPADGLVRVV